MCNQAITVYKISGKQSDKTMQCCDIMLGWTFNEGAGLLIQ